MLVGSTQAQAPLNASDLNTTIGTEFRQYFLTSEFAGSPGTDQVWDFTNLFAEAQENLATFEYGSTGAESNFPDANTAWSFNFDSFFQFYTVNDNEFTYHGVYEEGGFQLIYSDPIQYAGFPMELGQTFNDSYTSSYNVNGTEGNIEGTYEAEVDGNGILQLPWGDVPMAFRVSGTLEQTETFEMQDDTVEAFFNGTYTTFFAPGYPGPLITVQSGVVSIPDLGINQPQQQTSYLGDFEFLGVDDMTVVNDLKVFPNPSNGLFTLTFENKSNRDISLEVMDIQGRVVHAEAAIGSGFGTVLHEFDLSDLNPGFYLMRLSDGEHFQGRKIHVVR